MNTAEELLVDDGWKVVEIEPETVDGVDGHSSLPCPGYGGNGRRDGIGPAVELVAGNGHVSANGNGNGHPDEAEEPQQSLFSWAEFMAGEPMKAKGRKAHSPSMSLFEWAVEQSRGPETVGAGR